MSKHPNLLTHSSSLLIIVDVQSILLAAMPANDATIMLSNALTLCSAATKLNIPILVSEQYPQGLGATDPSLLSALPTNCPIFTKTSFAITEANGFTETLSQYQCQQLILLGQETHICILQSALDLAAEGYAVYIVEDAVCSRQPSNKISALQRLQQQGITITNTESVLFEWLANATHPDFKVLSRLIR